MLDPVSVTPESARNAGPASHERILSSAAILAAATVVAKLIAFGKDLLVARTFGAGDSLDAFLVAFVVPSFAVTVLSASFAPAFIPMYLRTLEHDGRNAADQLANHVSFAMMLVVVTLSFALPVVGPLVLPWLGSGFDDAKLALAERLLLLVAGVLAASGVSAVVTAILHAHGQFAPGALASWAVPAATLLALWLGHKRFGIDALALGTTLGFAAEALCLIVVAAHRGLLPRLRWRGGNTHGQGFASRYFTVALAGVLASSSVVVDQAMAASLAGGSVSRLNYGSKIVSLALGMMAVSLGTAIFPNFSRLIATHRWNELRSTLRRFSLAIVLVSIPCIALFAGLAAPMIRLLFEHGEFTAVDTQAASQVQHWLALEIPFYMFVTIGFRLLSALDANHLIVGIGVLSLALNIGADLVLMHYFGVQGIAMATSLVCAVAAAATLLAIRGRLPRIESAPRP